MKFRSELSVKKIQPGITHANRLMLIGSCFTENIGQALREHKFTVMENPNGILFNPVSVADAIDMYIRNEAVLPSQLFEWQECWHSWRHHSRFSGITREEAIRHINASTAAAHDYLQQADYLMITLGSAWVYDLTAEVPGFKGSGVAANNHKAPADWFRKRLLTVEETLVVLDNTIHRLLHFNPSLRILFTISPVRHLREGMIENNRSKAVLIQAVHHLVDKFEKLHYFPAYELVIDDLRDYRFYAEDLVHPNYQATRYVWEKFTEACMDADTIQLMEEIREISLAFRHRPFNPSTSAHTAFLEKYAGKTHALSTRHPEIDMSAELTYFRQSGSSAI